MYAIVAAHDVSLLIKPESRNAVLSCRATHSWLTLPARQLTRLTCLGSTTASKAKPTSALTGKGGAFGGTSGRDWGAVAILLLLGDLRLAQHPGQPVRLVGVQRDAPLVSLRLQAPV